MGDCHYTKSFLVIYQEVGYAISKMPDPPGEPDLGPANGSGPTDSPPPPPPPPVPIMPGCEFGATLFSEEVE